MTLFPVPTVVGDSHYRKYPPRIGLEPARNLSAVAAAAPQFATDTCIYNHKEFDRGHSLDGNSPGANSIGGNLKEWVFSGCKSTWWGCPIW